MEVTFIDGGNRSTWRKSPDLPQVTDKMSILKILQFTKLVKLSSCRYSIKNFAHENKKYIFWKIMFKKGNTSYSK